MPSLPSLFLTAAAKDPDSMAFFAKNKNQVWQGMSRQAALERTAGIARRLYAFGVTPGTRVGILAETCAEWAIVDMAVMALGGTVVGIYPSLKSDRVCAQLRAAEVSVLILDNDARYSELEEGLDELEELIHILCMDVESSLLPLTPAEYDEDWFGLQISRVHPKSTAAIVFSSGTTGESKGVVISHENMLSNLHATQSVFPLPPNQRAIVCLPLAHVLQRFAVYRGLIEDIVGYFCRIDELSETLEFAQPTVMMVVPRMLEKIVEKAESVALSRGLVAASIFKWGIAVAQSKDKKRIRWQRPLAEHLVLRKVRSALGGSLALVVSGGAPLKPKTAHFFEALGIAVAQGWGLTETAAPATVTIPDHPFDGSVGLPLPNTHIKIAPDGEVLVQGKGVFSGYLDAPDLNFEAFTSDGFFKTGDLGHVDDRGRLWITGRKKNLIITAGGKNIAPARIQREIEGGLISHALIVGEQRPYLCALIALDADALAEHAARMGLSGDETNWRTHASVSKRVLEQIEVANGLLAPFEQIKKHAILPISPSIENDGLTPTLKLKTDALMRRYSGRIAAFYD